MVEHPKKVFEMCALLCCHFKNSPISRPDLCALDDGTNETTYDNENTKARSYRSEGEEMGQCRMQMMQMQMMMVMS